ncbi:hypothetical protein B7463_g10080, partial [Scytalidium lignicola]
MWDHHRAKDYTANKMGYSEMFLIGPKCLDLAKLGLDPLSPFENCTTPCINDRMRDLDLSSQAPGPDGTFNPSSQLLLDEISRLQQTLRSRDDEIKNLKESQYIHTQISSGSLRARGPLDKEVLETIDHIIGLIRQNTISFPHMCSTSFTEMKTRYQPLYELHQHVYGIDLEDTLSIVHLGALGIPEVGNVDILRALVGMNVLQIVFQSSFPDFFHDRGSVALIYEEVIKSQFGKIAQSIFLQSAQYKYIKDPIFSDKIVPAEAKTLSESLNDILWPMLRIPNSGSLSSSGHQVPPKDIWKKQEQTMQEVFEQALTLRAELWLNPDKYRFFWPLPNSTYDKREIRGDDDELLGCKAEDLKVLITLFPGIYAWDADSVTRNGMKGQAELL